MTDPSHVDRILGAVWGFAVGDALGFPYRGVSPQALANHPQLALDFPPRPKGRFPKGQFSYHTQVAWAVLESCLVDRRLSAARAAEHIAALWSDGIVLQPPASLTRVIDSQLRGLPYRSSGQPSGHRDTACLSRGLPLGLLHHQTLQNLAHDAVELTAGTHKDSTCAAANAAWGMALKLQLHRTAFTPESFCQAVAEAASRIDPDFANELHHLPAALDWPVSQALDTLRRIGVPSAQLQREIGLPNHVTPVTLTAFYLVLKMGHDFQLALETALHLGGEIDIAAALVGSLLGARLGASRLPAPLTSQVAYGEELAAWVDRWVGDGAENSESSGDYAVSWPAAPSSSAAMLRVAPTQSASGTAGGSTTGFPS